MCSFPSIDAEANPALGYTHSFQGRKTMAKHPRQIVAIMFTDLCGYSAAVQRNEAQALEMLKLHWALLRPVFTGFDGREIKTIGDAFLIEFTSTL
jgi:class 3 adenylate cyclase